MIKLPDESINKWDLTRPWPPRGFKEEYLNKKEDALEDMDSTSHFPTDLLWSCG